MKVAALYRNGGQGVRRVAASRVSRALRAPRSALRNLAVLAAAASVLLAACSVEPRPIQLGAEECSHCRMAIDEPRFAAQALNTKGRAFSFDAIECMAEWVRAGEAVPAAQLHSLWVTDFSDPERWLRAEDAVFLRSPEVRSPMGEGLTAHASAEAARRYQAELGGELLNWTEVLEVVGLQGGHGHNHHAGG